MWILLLQNCLLASVRCLVEHSLWGSTLGILFSGILKVVITKECPSGGTKATKQPYKLNRTLLVAISLPWVVNHCVCHREVYVVCAQSATTSKLWERAERGGTERVLSPFSKSRSTSKDPAYNIRCRHFVCLTGKSSQEVVLVETLSRWEQVILVSRHQMLQSLTLLIISKRLHLPSDCHENIPLVTWGPDQCPQIAADTVAVTAAVTAGWMSWQYSRPQVARGHFWFMDQSGSQIHGSVWRRSLWKSFRRQHTPWPLITR